MESTLRRAWAEISLDALTHNVRVLQSRVSPSGFVGVVKADAYGHGAIQVSKALEEAGAEYLAVSSVDEARELREGGVELPVLQLGLTPADQTRALLAYRVTQTVYRLDAARGFAREAEKAGGRLPVHIKLDTGMSRLGFPCDEAHFRTSLEEVLEAASLPGLAVEGIFTHFALADAGTEEGREFTLLQYRRFREMVASLEGRGLRFRYRHCLNSGGAALYPELGGDLFRPGILTYGLGEQAGGLGLRPVMTVKAAVGCIRTLDKGTAVSYGCTFRTDRPSRVGVLSIGYADGLRRGLSNRWQVWTARGFAPLVGRICMDMCMVDFTDLPEIREGDEVEVYGPHAEVNLAADLLETIPYEITCGISRRTPRVYLREGREVCRELLLRDAAAL